MDPIQPGDPPGVVDGRGTTRRTRRKRRGLRSGRFSSIDAIAIPGRTAIRAARFEPEADDLLKS